MDTPILTRPNPNDVLDIHIPNFTKMIAEHKAFAFLVCGDSGVGKSYGVETTLKQYPNLHWDVYGGEISPIGLYRKLFENRNGVLVFDDIDAVFAAKGASDILKNALNSKVERRISYIKKSADLFDTCGMNDEDISDSFIHHNREKYPNSFVFKGGCIFISNKDITEINSAVRDRSIAEVVVKFTLDEMMQRIKHIIDNLEPDHAKMERNEKFEVLHHLYESAKKYDKKISIRSYIKAMTYKTMDQDHWKELIDYYIK